MRLFIMACFLCSWAATLSAAEKTITGKVKSVDLAKNSIVVDDTALDVSRKTKLVVNGKQASLKDITVGQQVKATYDDALETAISIVAGEDDGKATMAAMKLIQGEWRCIAGEENGKPQEQSKVNQEYRRLVIKGNSLTMQKAGQSWTGKFEIDSTNGDFDWIGKNVPQNQLVEWIGIYELEDDTLKLCFIFNKNDKAKRPTSFKTMPPVELGLAHACYTFKREHE